MLARQLGNVSYFDESQERELLTLKQKWGWADPRNTEEYKNCDICANDIFRESWKQSGVQRRAFPSPPAMPAKPQQSAPSANGNGSSNGAPPVLKQAVEAAVASAGAVPAGANMEQLVKLITEQVIRELQSK
jgi:L-fuculose-phosphate aldolase